MSHGNGCIFWIMIQIAIQIEILIILLHVNGVQWNPSCEATPFLPEMWPFKRGGLSSGVEINIFMFRFTLSIGFPRGVGLSSGWPIKRGSTVYDLQIILLITISSLFLRFLYLQMDLMVAWLTITHT